MRGSERRNEDSIAADLEFHREISHATGNAYILTFISFIASQIRYTIYLARRAQPIDVVVAETIAEHQAIYDALADRDIPRAAMRAHVRQLGQRVGAALPDRQKREPT